MTDLELGWVAGIVDGEGCIGLYRRAPVPGVNGGSWILNITVTSVTPSITNRLQELVEGSIITYARPQNEKWKRAYRWWIPHKDAKVFLVAIIPCLIEKRQQAELGLEFLKTIGRSGRRVLPGVQEERERIVKEMKELKHAPLSVT